MFYFRWCIFFTNAVITSYVLEHMFRVGWLNSSISHDELQALTEQSMQADQVRKMKQQLFKNIMALQQAWTNMLLREDELIKTTAVDGFSTLVASLAHASTFDKSLDPYTFMSQFVSFLSNRRCS